MKSYAELAHLADPPQPRPATARSEFAECAQAMVTLIAILAIPALAAAAGLWLVSAAVPALGLPNLFSLPH